MKGPLFISFLSLAAVVSLADDVSAPAQLAPAATTPTTPARAARPRQAPPAAPITVAGATDGKTEPTTDPPKFVSEAKWGVAGYNNNEVYYTIFVTNQDQRILRCTTEIQGVYFLNGEKSAISDRQITTVFPNQPTQVGIWMDMDESSGATYSVKCHSI
jgi:hypothetical protein